MYLICKNKIVDFIIKRDLIWSDIIKFTKIHPKMKISFRKIIKKTQIIPTQYPQILTHL